MIASVPPSVPPPIDLTSVIEARDPFEAVLIFTRTGKVIAAWTKKSVPVEVVTVMAATLIGSIETMSEALGGPGPREIALIVDGRRMLALKVNPQVAVLVIAPTNLSGVALHSSTQRLLRKLPPLEVDRHGQRPGTRS